MILFIKYYKFFSVTVLYIHKYKLYAVYIYTVLNVYILYTVYIERDYIHV